MRPASSLLPQQRLGPLHRSLAGLLGVPSAPQLAALEQLIDLARAEPPREELPNLLLQSVQRIFQPHLAAVYSPSSTPGFYDVSATYPSAAWEGTELLASFKTVAATAGAIGKALRSQEPIFVEDPRRAARDGEYIPFSSSISRELVIPIFAFDALAIHEIGVAIIVLSFVAGRFSDADRWMARVIQASLVTIYNRAIARERRERRLEFLQGVTNFPEEHLDRLFLRSLESLYNLIGSKFLSLWLYDEKNDLLVLRSFFPRSLGQKPVAFASLESPVLEVEQSPTGRAVREKRAVLVPDVRSEPGFANPKFASINGLHWFVSCPVLGPADEVLGVVNIWPSGHPHDFDQETRDALSRYIRPAAATIRLAELLMSQALLENLEHFQGVFSLFEDKEEDWNRLAVLVRSLLVCEGCSIFLLDGDELVLRGTTGIAGSLPASQVRYKPGEGLTGYALTLAHPYPYYLELAEKYKEIHISKHRERTGAKSKSILLGQIRAQDGRAIGVIRCTNKEEAEHRGIGRFTKPDILLLSRVGAMVSQLHGRAEALRAQERERTQRLNSLHHEILSPMDAFAVHTEWLDHHLRDHEQLRSFDLAAMRRKFSDMRQNAQLVEVLVTSMGQYDTGLTLSLSEVHLPGLVNTCKIFLTGEAKRQRIAVKVEYLGVPRVKADELHLMRVLYNLLRNALKYRDPEEKARVIRICGRQDEGYVAISIEDNGIGVPVDEQDAIFQKFERGSNAAIVFPEGTGLGLHYCKVVLSAHGGDILISRCAKPTVFEIRLPYPHPEDEATFL